MPIEPSDVSPDTVSEPTAEESVAGGSYIDKSQPSIETQLPDMSPDDDALAKNIAQSAKGRASHINDFDLTMQGIADGDPVGLETFDLGFFEDGTPAITINGANVPIRQDQWMSLLNARAKTRDEMSRRLEFAKQKARAVDSVSRITRAMQLNPGMAELFMAQAQIDPEMAMSNLNKLYVSMQTGKSKNLETDIAAQLTSAKIAPSWKHLTGDRGTIDVETTDPYGNTVTEKKRLGSITEEKARTLMAGSTKDEQLAGLAFSRPGDVFIDPNFRKAYPGQRIGIFDKIAHMEQDRYGPMSLFERMKVMAKHGNGVWPEQIDIVNPPMVGTTKGQPTRFQFGAPADDFMNYLQRLDQFYANIGGWDLSTPESLQQVATEYAKIYWQQHGWSESQNDQSNPVQPSQQQQQAPSRGSRAPAI